jgi:hypothetical protein
MPLVHGVRLLLTELNGTGALHNLFCDDVATLRGLGKKERVISLNVLTISEPSEPAIRLKLPHAAFDVESEGLPRDSCILPEPMIRSIQNLDVLRVRVPGGLGLCIDEIREGDLASGLDVDLIVRKEVRLIGLEPIGPMKSGCYATRRRRHLTVNMSTSSEKKLGMMPDGSLPEEVSEKSRGAYYQLVYEDLPLVVADATMGTPSPRARLVVLSSSSSVRGQSFPSSRDRLRSASTRPSV